MLAVSRTHPFDSQDHDFEIKWDGYRCLVFLDGKAGHVILQSRHGTDLSSRFPMLRTLKDHFSRRRAILDGEIVAWTKGMPDFHRLRFGGVQFLAFDLLHLDGRDLDREPYSRRRQRLEETFSGANAPAFQVPPAFPGEGKRLYAFVEKLGLEGIVAKRRTSFYLPGRRSGDWIKIKREHILPCVIGGVTQRRGGGLGALLVGAYEEPMERLRYLGRVGTGFSEREAARLLASVRASRISPFMPSPTLQHPPPLWLVPEKVCNVGYLEVTPTGRLRHPVYRGLREDLAPRECRVPWMRAMDKDP